MLMKNCDMASVLCLWWGAYQEWEAPSTSPQTEHRRHVTVLHQHIISLSMWERTCWWRTVIRLLYSVCGEAYTRSEMTCWKRSVMSSVPFSVVSCIPGVRDDMLMKKWDMSSILSLLLCASPQSTKDSSSWTCRLYSVLTSKYLRNSCSKSR